jgi:hypothetical protein
MQRGEEEMKNEKELRLKDRKEGELSTELLTVLSIAGAIFSTARHSLLGILVFSVASIIFVSLSIVFHVAIERTKKK